MKSNRATPKSSQTHPIILFHAPNRPPLAFWRTLVRLFLALGLGASTQSSALTITSGPLLATTTNAPLAASLQLSTDVPTRVSVSVSDSHTNWTHDFLDYNTNHTEILLGFKSQRTNAISVTVHDLYRNTYTAPSPLTFITPPLPTNFPPLVLLTNQPAKMEPGYTLFRLQNLFPNAAFLTIVDNSGEVVWYSPMFSTLDVRQLSDGDLFLPISTNFAEINMFGQTVHTWNQIPGYNINDHDGVPTSHGTILYLTDLATVVPNFPTSSTDSNAPTQSASVDYNAVVEISQTNGALLNTWSLISMLQPTRIDYLTFSIHTALGWDCEHANAVLEDPSDNSLIVSLRHQDAVIKFTRAGQLVWILGPHENWSSQFQPYLLTPVGTPFDWNYAQHAPMLTPQGTLMVYDDGNFRASPFDAQVADSNNWTRAVEFNINEQTMEVSQVWDYGRTNTTDRIYTSRLGNADALPITGNVLINFGNVDYENGVHPSSIAPNATMLRIKEVTHGDSPEVVFDLAAFNFANTNKAYTGTYAYRSHRIPDLYSHLPQSVSDLALDFSDGRPHLHFSGDAARSYHVQGSEDLQHWSDLGDASNSGGADFDFADPEPDEHGEYYRVITE